MVTAMVFAVGVALMAAAYWVHSQLEELLGRWARRLALGCVAHAAVFFGAATCVALVRPAPQEVTYESIAKREDATWYQHGAAYLGYGSGWLVEETRPRFLYGTAQLTDGSTLVGLPGVQKLYRL